LQNSALYIFLPSIDDQKVASVSQKMCALNFTKFYFVKAYNSTWFNNQIKSLFFQLSLLITALLIFITTNCQRTTERPGYFTSPFWSLKIGQWCLL